jgi:Transglutaminase-like superfamily
MAVRAPESRQPSPSVSSRTPAGQRRLGRLERTRLVIEIVLAYVRTRRALKRAPIAAALAGLRRQSPPREANRSVEDRLPEARRLGRAVTRALAIVPGDTRCLMQALVLTRLLARRGIATKLVIGARTSPSFLAHAWVEHAGQPVLATGDGLFDRLVEL